MIRLIASDIDGTLLQRGATEIPQEVFEAIRELKQRGIYFCAASGRRYDSLRELFAPVIESFAKLFKEEANVRLIMNHMLNVALDFAIKVFHGEMAADDDYTKHVFLVIYRSIEPYFKEKEQI